ncbi:unnamed protein product [Scytosiphon promiscuus]
MRSAGNLLLLLVLCLLLVGGGLSQAAAGGDSYCEDLSADDDRIVSTADDASTLAADLERCPGIEFNVGWRGTIAVSQPFELTESTTLRISGENKAESVLHGGGDSTLFQVFDFSELYLEDLRLTGGYGDNGGALTASGGASVTFVNCDVCGNRASANGGAIHLDGGSSFTSGGVNFTGNAADVYGGAIYAQDRSIVRTEDGTTNLFHDNTAMLGGAIHAQDSSDVLFGSDGDVSFDSNSALFEGGAVNLEYSSFLKTDGTAVFTNNTSENSGGAIRAYNGSEVSITGNTTFLNNSAQNDGGAIVVTQDAAVRTRGDTKFINNFAQTDGGAVKAEDASRVQIAGQTLFQDNTVGQCGGAISVQDGATVTTVGETLFEGNQAQQGGAVYAKTGVVVAFAGLQVFNNNTALSHGGAIYLTFATSVAITGRPQFSSNAAKGGSGGAIYCASTPQVVFKNANFTENDAQWGGAVALFSSGGSATSSSSDDASIASTDPFNFWTSGGGYDQSDLTPSLDTGAEASSSATVTSLVPDFSSSTFDEESSTSTPKVLPVKLLDCQFTDNHAREDGGAIFSVAGFDMIQGSQFVGNRADGSGGALVQAGVTQEITDTLFEANGAGNEGPAVLSLGLLSHMSGVTFDNNAFFCEEGMFSSEIEVRNDSSSTAEDTCRFERVCSRCASKCGSALQSGAVVVGVGSLPTCDVVPEGSQTTTRGGTLETLEILPGFYRSSENSTDIRECFYEGACQGGQIPGEYCAKGYGGPYCAVCKKGYSPGYSYTCKSCFGDSKRRALGTTAVIATVATAAAIFLVAKLLSVVETGAPAKTQSRWQQKCSEWQARMRTRVPLNAFKIMVVVWQIVTQYSDVAGVRYAGVYADFLSVVDLVNLDLGFILSFACVYDTNFYDRLLMATIGPVVVLGILGCTYIFARRRNGHSMEAMAVVKHRHLSIALFVMFMVYSTVSYTIFQTFECDELDDGKSYLRADYSLTCSTPLHGFYQAYAGLMVVVYPLGVPCVFGWWLFKHRHELTETDRANNTGLRPLADLWEPYKRDKYYYEVVECFRRIALTGLAVFIYPDSSAQIAVVLLLAAAFMVVSEILAPFARPVEMWLYRAGHYVVFASMYLALLLRVDVSDEHGQSQEVFSGVIVIAHGAMLLVVVAQGLLIFVSWGDDVEVPGALKSVDADLESDRNRDFFMKKGDGRAAREWRGGGEGASRCVCVDVNYRGKLDLEKAGKSLGEETNFLAKDAGGMTSTRHESNRTPSSKERKVSADSISSVETTDKKEVQEAQESSALSKAERHPPPDPTRSHQEAISGVKSTENERKTMRFASTPGTFQRGGEEYMGDFARGQQEGGRPLAPRSAGRPRSIFARPEVGWRRPASADQIDDSPLVSRDTAAAQMAAAGLATRVHQDSATLRAREGRPSTAAGSEHDGTRSWQEELPTPSEEGSGRSAADQDAGKDRRGARRAVMTALDRGPSPCPPIVTSEEKGGLRREVAAPDTQRTSSNTRGVEAASVSGTREPQVSPVASTASGPSTVLGAALPAVDVLATAGREPKPSGDHCAASEAIGASSGDEVPRCSDSRPSPLETTVLGKDGVFGDGVRQGTPSSGLATERYRPSSQVVLSPVESAASWTSSLRSAPVLAPLSPSVMSDTPSPQAAVSPSGETASHAEAEVRETTEQGRTAAGPAPPETGVSATRSTPRAESNVNLPPPVPVKAAEAEMATGGSKTQHFPRHRSTTTERRPASAKKGVDHRPSSKRVSAWSRWVPGTVGTGQGAAGVQADEGDGSDGRGPDAAGCRERRGGEGAIYKMSPTEIDAMFPVEDEVEACARHEREALRGKWAHHASSAAGQAAATESLDGDAASAGQSLVDIRRGSSATRGCLSPSAGSSVSMESGWSIGGPGAGGGGGGGFAGNAKRSFFPEPLAPLCVSPAGVAAASAWRVDASDAHGLTSPRKRPPGR